MATVEFNEMLFDSLPVDHVGNAAFGMWVRCVIKAAWQEFPTYVISKDTAARQLGSRALLKKLLTPVGLPPLYAGPLLEVVTDLPGFPDFANGHWIRPVNWQVGSTYRPAFVIRRERKPIPAPLRARVYERDGHRCVECGATKGLTLDHILAHSNGGPDSFANLRTLCGPCNSAKGNRVE